MRPLSIFALLVLAALQPAPAQKTPAAASPVPPKFRISGTILNSVTNQPVARIEVSISPTERDDGQQFVTGSDGRFVFEGLVRGKYSLSAHGPGFVPQAYQQHGMFSTAIAVGPGLA